MPETRSETITAPDGFRFTATLTLPPSGSGPGIVLLQEIFGVNDFILGKAADLAERGYVVLAPDVFARVEPGVALAHDEAALQQAFALVGRYWSELEDGTRRGDLVAAHDHLAGLEEVTGGTAALGYCLGGLLAYLVAADADPGACVSYYGSNIADRLDLAERITCPVLFHFGGQDPYIPAEQVAAIRAAFAGRADVEIRVDAGAGHAFENLLAPAFANPEAAARSWPATLDFLDRHLPAAGGAGGGDR